MSALAEAPPIGPSVCEWSLSALEFSRPQCAMVAEFIPMTERAALIAALSEVFHECALPNWNGYSARPVGVEAYSAALRLLHSLPGDLPNPEISAIPDGLLSFEWRFEGQRVVVVVPNVENGVNFMIREGSHFDKGNMAFFGALPEQVLVAIRRFSK